MFFLNVNIYSVVNVFFLFSVQPLKVFINFSTKLDLPFSLLGQPDPTQPIVVKIRLFHYIETLFTAENFKKSHKNVVEAQVIRSWTVQILTTSAQFQSSF